MTNIPHLTIIIPAYNEAERIVESLSAIKSYMEKQTYSINVVLVDDGSTDNTFDICTTFAEQNQWLNVLSYKNNEGKGYAVRKGMLYNAADFLLFCDADMSTPLEELDQFWDYINQGADIVIASRPLPGSSLVKRQPIYREMAGRLLNKYIQIVAVPGIQDTQCGFKLFKREAAVNVFNKCVINGFSFDIEVLHLSQKLGYKIKEAPVHWYHKSGSKVHLLQDGLRLLYDTIKIRLRHRRIKNER